MASGNQSWRERSSNASIMDDTARLGGANRKKILSQLQKNRYHEIKKTLQENAKLIGTHESYKQDNRRLVNAVTEYQGKQSEYMYQNGRYRSEIQRLQLENEKFKQKEKVYCLALEFQQKINAITNKSSFDQK